MYFKKLEIIGFKSFYNKTTLHFEPGVTAVVGPNGCGKCLHYDSLVTLSDGKQVKIGDLVEGKLKLSESIEKMEDGIIAHDNPDGIKILSIDPTTLKIEPRPVSAFIKRTSPGFLLKITAKSGRCVTTTHYHPFFSIRDGRIYELKAEDLRAGEKIITPRTIPTVQNSDEINPLAVLKKFCAQDHVYVSCSTGEFAVNKTAAPAFLEKLKETGMNCIPDGVGILKSRSGGEIKLPRKIDESLARFLGYIISEGRTTPSNQVWFVNEEKEVVDDYIACAESVFGVEARVFKYRSSTSDVLIFSSVLCQFLEKAFDLRINGVSKEKKVPPALFSCPDETIIQFLSALFEGDGHICVKKQGIKNVVYFEYATASEELAKGIITLLLRLGIQPLLRSKMKAAVNTVEKKKRRYYSVYVYGIENAQRLALLLKFVGKKKATAGKLISLDYKTNQNLDVVPGINGVLKDLVRYAGIKIKRFRKISPKLAAYYENRCLPTRKGLSETLALIAEHGDIRQPAKSLYDYLKLISASDIYWDEITSIERVGHEGWVYDLSVAGTHNFIAENFVVHNSNIFDSIRWVLGEQSVKSLRGSSMEDVIFSGTESKEALSMAEVSLTFDNSNKFFPVEHNEVVITRRIFRSGESEYLLNKMQVRLKDILDLLMGTGIGAESYSLIPQGRIDMILSSRPEDRRLVFDEASGITKYKTQKREAIRKLEETDQNLLRVNDIVAEVKRQIGSLERQANKARRYKEVFDELKAKELALATAQKADFEKTRNEFITRLAILESQESAVANLIKEKEAAISGSQAEVSTLQEAILSLKNEIMNLENLVSRNAERITFDKERILELKTGGEQLTAQLEQAKARLAADEEKLNALKEEHAALNKNIEEKSTLLKEKETRLGNISSAIKLSLENIQAAKKHILELAARIAVAKNELADLNSRQQILSARKKRLELEKLKTGEEKAAIETDLSGIKQELDSIQKDFDELNNKISDTRAGRERENAGLENINAEIDSLEKQKLSLTSQKQFLEELRTKYDDISESLNAVIYLDKVPTEKISGLVVKVTDMVQEEPAKLKVSGEAKPFDLDTHNIEEKINEIEGKTEALRKTKADKEARIQELNTTISQLQELLRQQEISLINKKAAYESVSGQFNKIKDEEELIVMELGDVENDLGLRPEQKLTHPRPV